MSTGAVAKGRVVVISGPSGVGKSTICSRLVGKINAELSISVTSRKKSDKEIDGEHYHFVSRDEFEKQIAEGKFIEYAEVFGNYYGTPREPLEEALGRGRIIILEIDVQGARQIKKIYPDTVMIFVLPPSQSDLADRMRERARGEDSDTARLRLNHAGSEIAAAWQYYEHMVVNQDLDLAIDEIIQIIKNS